MRSTYRAATLNTVVAAANDDIFFVISGSATVTRHIRKIRVSGATLTTLAVGSVAVEKWSTAPTGGTATTLTRTPVDSAFPAAATDGLVQVYTAAPTEGTLVGTIACRRHIWKSATIAEGAPFADLEFDFTDMDSPGSQLPPGVPLHGTAQALSLAFGADPASAITLAVEVEWTEEAGR